MYLIVKGAVSMDFFNDLGKRFSNVARSMTEKARENGEINRISDDLKALNAELDRLYCDFGRACFAIRQGKGDSSGLEEKEKRILALQRQIDELAAQRDDLKDVRRCPACGAVQPRNARFCAACGKRLPEDAPAVEAAPAQNRYCPTCGAMIDKDARACDVCGRSFEAEIAPVPEPVDADVPPINVEEPDAADEME